MCTPKVRPNFAVIFDLNEKRCGRTSPTAVDICLCGIYSIPVP
jgi:hypothetical protein